MCLFESGNWRKLRNSCSQIAINTDRQKSISFLGVEFHVEQDSAYGEDLHTTELFDSQTLMKSAKSPCQKGAWSQKIYVSWTLVKTFLRQFAEALQKINSHCVNTTANNQTIVRHIATRINFKKRN